MCHRCSPANTNGTSMCSGELVRVAGEPVTAVVRAEMVRAAAMTSGRRRVLDLDLDAAHRVLGIARAGAEPATLAVQPVDRGERGDRDEVKHRRIVPGPHLATGHFARPGHPPWPGPGRGGGDAGGPEQILGS